MSQYKPLGKTGLNTTPISLGLAALGRPGYINLGHESDLPESRSVSAMRAHAFAVLDAAWEAGIRHFDAARSYGKAEDFLGAWLAARAQAPQGLLISSKWGYIYTADWQVEAEHHEVKEHTLPVLDRQWQESQEALGIKPMLYQIHSATLDSGVLDRPELLDRLWELKAGGCIIGLSLSGPRQTDTLLRALEIQRGEETLFQCVQATWNLLEPSAGPALQLVHSRGWGVMVKEALANGRLTQRNHHPSFQTAKTLLQEEAERLQCSLDALALAAVMAQPWCDTVLSGAARIDHLHSNLQARHTRFDAAAALRLEVIQEAPEVYWQHRKGLTWN